MNHLPESGDNARMSPASEPLTEPRGREAPRDERGKSVAVSGAGGLVGSALVRELQARGYRVLRLVRRAVRDPAAEIAWDPANGRVSAEDLRGLHAVVNLAGRSIAAGRWTDAVKREIRSSRVEGTRALAEALAEVARGGSPAPALINASAIGFYGDRGAEPLDESSPAGEGFLAETTQAWEAATRPAVEAGVRVVLLRFGVVLSASGGALAKMLTPFRLGLGGQVGHGRQMVSWIGLADLVSVIAFALEEPELRGALNAVAPAPVSNAELTQTLARMLSRPAVLPLPEFAVGLLLGEMGRALLLASTYVIPRRLEGAGFVFRHPTLEPALRAALAHDTGR